MISRKEKGFTLIEVAVALAILAIVAVSMMKATGSHLAGVGQLEEITFATYVANNRLSQLQVSAQWPPKNNEKGEQEMADRTWYWRQSVTSTEDKDLRQVEVFVSLDQNEEYSITSVVGFFAKPTLGTSP